MLTEIPPQDREAEQAVITSCLLGEADIVCEVMHKEDFYFTAHALAFDAIRSVLNAGDPVNLVTVTSKLRQMGELERIGGASYLAKIMDNVPVIADCEAYCRLVQTSRTRRTIIETCQKAIGLCHGREETDDVLDSVQRDIAAIGGQNRSAAVSYSDIAVDCSQRYEALYRTRGKLSGIATGYRGLDWMTCGLQPSDLIVLAARPSMGKTALALNIANHVAKAGDPVAIFSLEMSRQQLYDRTVAQVSGVNSMKFRSGEFEPDDWAAVMEGQEVVYSWPVHIDDTSALNYMEIKRRLRKLKNKHGIKLAIVDHLQLVRGDNAGSRDREIGSITGGLKAAAKDMGMPIILVSQLNRGLEQRPNPYKRPRLSDLRDSGNIEQDADIVMFLYRPAVYEDKEKYDGHTELTIAKQRNGPTGTVELVWNSRISKFYGLDKQGGMR